MEKTRTPRWARTAGTTKDVLPEFKDSMFWSSSGKGTLIYEGETPPGREWEPTTWRPYEAAFPAQYLAKAHNEGEVDDFWIDKGAKKVILISPTDRVRKHIPNDYSVGYYDDGVIQTVGAVTEGQVLRALSLSAIGKDDLRFVGEDRIIVATSHTAFELKKLLKFGHKVCWSIEASGHREFEDMEKAKLADKLVEDWGASVAWYENGFQARGVAPEALSGFPYDVNCDDGKYEVDAWIWETIQCSLSLESFRSDEKIEIDPETKTFAYRRATEESVRGQEMRSLSDNYGWTVEGDGWSYGPGVKRPDVTDRIPDDEGRSEWTVLKFADRNYRLRTNGRVVTPIGLVYHNYRVSECGKYIAVPEWYRTSTEDWTTGVPLDVEFVDRETSKKIIAAYIPTDGSEKVVDAEAVRSLVSKIKTEGMSPVVNNTNTERTMKDQVIETVKHSAALVAADETMNLLIDRLRDRMAKSEDPTKQMIALYLDTPAAREGMKFVLALGMIKGSTTNVMPKPEIAHKLGSLQLESSSQMMLREFLVPIRKEIGPILDGFRDEVGEETLRTLEFDKGESVADAFSSASAKADVKEAK